MNMEKLFKKILLSEKDYEYLTKMIAVGGGFGIFSGSLFGEIIFFFSLGWVVGIIFPSICILIRRFK